MTDLIILSNADNVKQLMKQQNYAGSDAVVTQAMTQAAAKSMAIYAEADRTYPAAIGDDPLLDALVNWLACNIACKILADTVDGKRSAEIDINDNIKDIKLHIGIVDGKSEAESYGTVAVVGSTLTSLGDSGDDDS